jgi:(2Fe-2S) ferredoxin
LRYIKHIFICVNERDPSDPRGSCLPKGGAEVHARFKQALKERRLHGKMRANKAGCLDACEYGVTAVVYPDCVWYGGITVDDVDEIVDSHLVNDVPVQRLLIPDKRYTPPVELTVPPSPL